MTKLLDGKVAVVTGAASGIGRVCVRALARAGAAVVVADVNFGGAGAVASEIIAEGGRAEPVAVDLGDAGQIAAMIERAVSLFGRLDILHNNAAATHLASTRDLNVADMDPQVWDQSLRINLTGTMLATKLALPYLIAAGESSIVNTSSGAGLAGDAGHTAYGVSKAGINALTLYTAAQYGNAGVRCNAIAPGLVVTPATEETYAGPMKEFMLRHHLTPRLGQPDDIAALVVFLCSAQAGFITGQVISVDGGLGSHQPYLADVKGSV
ncbi:short-chain dehydrogenase [Mycobacterium sp. E342]|uniref:SDR family NAD(P)-dependent oxidoreductase n=1 Tax=unclassified Mycobacterium TaxID=2642494 RepID=UPI000800321F|nr:MULTISPECIES: SDR family oxidoreductase [unclassified Mycobacterium]OBH01640.1 short-chain dehydrogenase [Mycobacterium sp. E3247]OBH31515.1 short-chain dehydrogenase [Mycobacterium sp. E342]